MTKTYSISAIAEVIGGRFVGDGSIMINRVAHPADVRGEHDLVLATDKKLLPVLQESGAHAAVVSEDATVTPDLLKACIVVSRPRLALAKLTSLFAEDVFIAREIHPSAVLEPSAKIGANVAIGAGTYIGANAIIGDNCTIHPQVYVAQDAVIGRDALIHSGVRIGARVQIGDRFMIHFNSTIGADGFSFVTPQLGSVESAKSKGTIEATNQALVRIASLGSVIIGDDVEIGANSSIDRGTIVPTRIGNGTKIDNQVQIGHNVIIGENCMICGRVGIAGSAVIGNRVVLGGATGVADHVHIGDDSVAMGMSGISGNIAPKTLVGGIPAQPRAKAMETHYNISRIKFLMQKIESLTLRLDTLENNGKTD